MPSLKMVMFPQQNRYLQSLAGEQAAVQEQMACGYRIMHPLTMILTAIKSELVTGTLISLLTELEMLKLLENELKPSAYVKKELRLKPKRFPIKQGNFPIVFLMNL